MTIVSNTGPLIALAKIDQLTLLAQLFTTVQIPLAVQHELLGRAGPEAARLEEALSQFIQVMTVAELPDVVKDVTSQLDWGEQQALALAYLHRTLLILDERLGRAAARRLGIPVSGSVGVLVEAKTRGLIPAVLPLLKAMRRQGYWLSDDILAQAARLADESQP